MRPVGLEAIVKFICELFLPRLQIARRAKEFEDANGLASADDSDQIKFTKLKLLPRKPDGILTNNNARSIYVIGADEP